MHTLRQWPAGSKNWEVGYFILVTADDLQHAVSEWQFISGPHDMQEAARRVNYLNGGPSSKIITEG